jgi:hypothetical protein
MPKNDTLMGQAWVRNRPVCHNETGPHTISGPGREQRLLAPIPTARSGWIDATDPISRLPMMVRHCDDVDMVRFDRIKELVRETAHCQAPYVAALAWTGQRPGSDSWPAQNEFPCESALRDLELAARNSARLPRLLAGFGRKDHPHQVVPKISSAGTPRTLPAR